ncbi:helix-turn-helix domain-containing protein [Burkholderia sp. JPY481]|uniref:winged helix-turn-helix transcriptional regulator n=1 Tax=unclassified Paraburkholderia TaxID=2615204 RepID=UPI0031788E93
MKRREKVVATVCPVARSTEVVGDKWTTLVLREMYMGATRFEEIQIQTEATPQMLATRLKSLEADGMIERQPYQKRPVRYEYHLTQKGRAFYPVIQALRTWGETWCKSKGEEVAVRFMHRVCGHEVGLDYICPSCGEYVERSDLDAALSPTFAKEREKRREAYRAAKARSE